jgi:hypothetical protein
MKQYNKPEAIWRAFELTSGLTENLDPTTSGPQEGGESGFPEE